MDAIVHIVRAFEEENVTHVEGSIDPIRDIEIIETELLIRDIASVEKRMEKLQKTARIGDKESKDELTVLELIFSQMNDGTLVHDIALEENQKKRIRQRDLLTNKPTLYVANVDEAEITAEKRSAALQTLFDFAGKKQNAAIRLCGKLEAEIAALPADEKSPFLEEYNLPEPGFD